MTTTTLIPRSTSSLGASDAGRVTFARVLNAEWIKFRTLRSSWYTLFAGVAAMIAIGLIVAYATGTSNWATLDPEDTAGSATLQGYLLAQLLIGVLGVLFVSGEYGTGMIHSTFAAVPRRLPVVGAKAIVFGALALVVMTATSFVTFFAAQAVLSGYGHSASISDPGVLRAVAGVGVYLALIGLLGGAIGWIVRSTAGAIAGLMGLLLVIPPLVGLLPQSGFVDTVSKYLPSNAGESFVSSIPVSGMLSAWVGIAVLAAWVAVGLTAAAVVVRRRDA